MHLTSTQNARIKETIRLRKRAERDAHGLFLVEGGREVTRALAARWQVVSLFFCPALHATAEAENLPARAQSAGAMLFECSAEVFAKLAYKEGADGWLAVVRQRALGLDDLALSKKPLLLAAEAIEKPGNLGALLRAADGAGADAVILCDGCTDLYNPNVVRNSMGSLFALPVAAATSAATWTFLRRHKVRMVAATPGAEKIYSDVDLSGPVAIVVGAENEGLRPAWMEQADVQVRIPMRGLADSLNVACATTLLLYEAVRQRQGPATTRYACDPARGV